MEWLEAALAFAVIMMVLSTMVTVVIETAHRVFRLRENGLRRIMETMYGKVIQPRLAGGADVGAAGMKDFVEHMTLSQFQPNEAGGNGLGNAVPALLNATRLKSLSTLEFIERLAETRAGSALSAEVQRIGTEHGDALIKYLASKYESIGESASEYFARRARASSAFVAICLAFALNVNAIDMFKTLLTNQDVRTAWIAQGKKVGQQAGQQQQRLETVLAELKAKGEASAQEVQQAIAHNTEVLQATAASLESSGIPMGWARAPWHGTEWSTAGLPYRAWLVMQWLAAVLLAGLLIGLGGPFWFDTFMKLSSLTAILRGRQTPVQKAKEPSGAPADVDLTEIFATADKGQMVRAAPGPAEPMPEGKSE